MSSSRILWILLTIIIVSSIGFFVFKGKKGDENALLVKPRKGNFEVTVTTTGELRAKRSVKIYGPSNARRAGIWQIKINDLVAEGTVVEEGGYIARLDHSELKNKMQEVNLSVESAQSEFTSAKLDTALELTRARNEIINHKFVVDEKQAEREQSRFEAPATQDKARLAYEKAERTHSQAVHNYSKQVAQATAKVKTTELDLQKHLNKLNEYKELLGDFEITAPAAGMVIYKRSWNGAKVKTGSMLQMWNPVVATLPDLGEMQSVTYVNEIDIQRLKSGQKVVIGLDAMAGKELTGEVESVANIGEQRPNSDSKVFEVVIKVSQADTTLRPAMTTSNNIRVAQAEQVIYLPQECLFAREDLSFVFIQKGNEIIRKQVETGLVNENDVEIVKGLGIEDEVYLSMPDDTLGLKLVKF